jgi:hypothetical protein
MQGSWSRYSEKREGFWSEKEEMGIQLPQRQLPEHVQTICTLISNG